MLGLYFSIQGAEAAVAAARARASADEAAAALALELAGALPLSSAFAAAAAEAAASAVDVGASTMSASVISEKIREGERESLFSRNGNLTDETFIFFTLEFVSHLSSCFFLNLASIGCASSSPARAEGASSRDSSSKCRAGDASAR